MKKATSFLGLLLYYGLISYLSSRHQGIDLPWFPGVDKIFHLLEYAPVGFFLYHLIFLNGGILNSRTVGLYLVMGTVLAAIDEYHQSFVPGRTASMWDAAADLAGVGAGVCIAAYLRSKTCRTKAP